MKSKFFFIGLIVASLSASFASADCEYFTNDDGSYGGSVCTDDNGNSTQSDSDGNIMSGWGNGQHYSVTYQNVDGANATTASYTHSDMTDDGQLSNTYTGGYLYIDHDSGVTTQYGSNGYNPNDNACDNAGWHCEIGSW